MKKPILLTLCLFVVMPLVAQRFLYNVDFYGYFDNREYKAPYQRSQTLFAMRLSPEIGVGFTDKQGGQHKIMAGVHYTQPMGFGRWKDMDFNPTAYYQYAYKGFQMSMGAIPYDYRIEQMPYLLMYDSIAYRHANIQGALFQYQSRLGYVEAMCDWRSFPTQTRREMFRIVLNGYYQHHGFFTYQAGGWAWLNHKANMSAVVPAEGVADDIGVNPRIGIDFAPPTPLDTLLLQVGYVMSVQRDRDRSEVYLPQGLTCDFQIRWRFLGLQNTFYWGDSQMPLYHRWGQYLNQGDPFYRQPLYDRLALQIYILRKPFVECYFSYNLHFVQHFKPQHQQAFFVRFHLNKIPKLAAKG